VLPVEVEVEFVTVSWINCSRIVTFSASNSSYNSGYTWATSGTPPSTICMTARGLLILGSSPFLRRLRRPICSGPVVLILRRLIGVLPTNVNGNRNPSLLFRIIPPLLVDGNPYSRPTDDDDDDVLVVIGRIVGGIILLLLLLLVSNA